MPSADKRFCLPRFPCRSREGRSTPTMAWNLHKSCKRSNGVTHLLRNITLKGMEWDMNLRWEAGGLTSTLSLYIVVTEPDGSTSSRKQQVNLTMPNYEIKNGGSYPMISFCDTSEIVDMNKILMTFCIGIKKLFMRMFPSISSL